MGAWMKTAIVLANIGAINWGLNELNFNLVDKLIGSWSPMTATIVYYVIAICGLVALVKAFKK